MVSKAEALELCQRRQSWSLGRELFFNLFGDIYVSQGGDLYFIFKIPDEA